MDTSNTDTTTYSSTITYNTITYTLYYFTDTSSLTKLITFSQNTEVFYLVVGDGGDGGGGGREVNYTCYMNSVIQLIMNCPNFLKVILNSKNDSEKIQLFKSFIIKYFDNVGNSISPSEIKKIISSYPMFDSFEQHDAHECLIYLIDMLCEEVREAKYLFNLKIYTRIKNLEEEQKNLFSDEIVLSLPVSQNLSESYKLFCKKEIIDGWLSDKTNTKVRAEKQYIVCFWGYYVIIVFKKYNSHKKINTNIEIPHSWSIQNYTNSNVETISFEISGAIIHYGNLTSGHYIALVKKEGKFYLCNDSSIEEIKEPNDLINRAYIVLFKRE